MKNTYKTIFVSDIHLGSKDSKAEQLNNFLKTHTSDNLYLIGDIIDGWKITQNKWKWKKSHTILIRRILNFSKKGSKVIYVVGNHDEFLRILIPYKITFGNISIVNQSEYVGIDNKKYLIVHGDLFDGITKLAPWLSILGDKAYDVILTLNTHFNWLRHKLGFGYWSFSKFLKHRVKKAIDFMFQFEKNLATYCSKRKFDGVIFGHTHNHTIKLVDDIIVMNTGDFVESCTVLVESHQGDWIIFQLINDQWKPVLLKDINNNILSNDRCVDQYIKKGYTVSLYQIIKNEKNNTNNN